MSRLKHTHTHKQAVSDIYFTFFQD